MRKGAAKENNTPTGPNIAASIEALTASPIIARPKAFEGYLSGKASRLYEGRSLAKL